MKQIDQAPVVERAVPVANKSGAVYAQAQGRRWIRKTRAGMLDRGMLAEAVGWLFCQRLELPIPDVAVYLPGDYTKDCWLSEEIRYADHWEATKTPVENLQSLGSVLAVDAVLGNEDRHEGNILLQPEVSDEGESWKLWCIDFEASLVGQPQDFADLGLDLPSISQLPSDLPFEALDASAKMTAEEIASFDERFISVTVAEACTLGDSSEAELLEDALIARCRNAVGLVTDYFAELVQAS